MTKLSLLLLLSWCYFPGTSQAKVIQILHTNDLHAALHSAGAPSHDDLHYGGWAQIKTTMDQLTESAKTKDIETVRLDAGDFFEGTLSYFPDHGLNVLKAFQNMGYDAAAMGNHDWLMGAQNMNEIFGKSPFPFPVLSANTEFDSDLKNLNRQIIPSTQIVKGGIKIGIMGLSTDEIFYKWITKVDSFKYDMQILNYRDLYDGPGIANEEAAKLREENDLVIALTHIGVKQDEELAESSTDIDLIVGGHSHTRLDSLRIAENAEGKQVPIVQTGATGVYIGKILVDVTPGQKPQVLTYELIPVLNETPADPTIAGLLDVSEQRLANQYGAAKLEEVVGHSDTRLVSGSNGKTAYSKFVVDAMRDVTGADLALDMGEFHSNSAQPAGDVTKRKLMEMYPRKLNVEQNEGLYVYQFKIPGWALKLALSLAVKFGYDLSLSGIDYDTYQMEEKDFLAEQASFGDSWKGKALNRVRMNTNTIRINGKKLKLFKKYRVATPEFVVRGAYAVSWLTRLVMRHGRPTEYTIWDASEQYLRKVKDIHDDPSFRQDLSNEGDYPYGAELVEDVLHTLKNSTHFLKLPPANDET